MSRFGWPRPRPEGVVDELAALQAASGVPPVDDVGGLPPGVRAGTAFPTVRGTGYDTDQVDAFLARAASLTAAEIREVRFATTRKGYDLEAVDAALDRMARDRDAGS
jgi:DivIVA domain-containing protein